MSRLCHTEYASQKKTQLENSLLNLMMQCSYQDITVTDICRDVNIPRRTFYHYFGSKEDVLESIIESLMERCFLEGMFDFHLGIEHVEKRFANIFRFWTEENRKKLDALIKNGLESQLITMSSRWIQREQIGFIMNSNLDPKQMEIGLMVGVTDFFPCCFIGAGAAIRNLRRKWQNTLHGFCHILFISYKKQDEVVVFDKFVLFLFGTEWHTCSIMRIAL